MARDRRAYLPVYLDGVLVARRARVNLVTGSNVTLTVTDNPTDEAVDVEIAATGGAGTSDHAALTNLAVSAAKHTVSAQARFLGRKDGAGAGDWQEMTESEAAVILGLGSAAYTSSGDYLVPADIGATVQAYDTDLATLAGGGSPLQIPRRSSGGVLEWVDAPIVAGDGVSFFLDDSASDIATYFTLEEAPTSHPEVDDSVAVNAADGEVLIESYATQVGIPGTDLIQAGSWHWYLYAYVDASTSVSQIRIRVYKRTSGGVETELFNAITAEINATSTTLYEFESTQPAYTIGATDRIVVKFFALTTSVVSRTVHLIHNGTTSYSHIHTPILIPLDLGNILGTHGWVGVHTGSAGSGTHIAGIDDAGEAVELDFGIGPGDVCEGDDERIADTLTPATPGSVWGWTTEGVWGWITLVLGVAVAVPDYATADGSLATVDAAPITVSAP